MPTARLELTLTVVILGLILSVVMGAANVYLGLKVGMTVSASIPAAVIAMAILNGLLRRRSILEANLVQTAASAGESLAAGIIFTMPALILVGVWETFDFWTTTLIAFSGGLLGVLFMIPMRRVFIVDDKELLFPEGLACAEVLRTGEQSDGADPAGGGAAVIFAGVAVGGLFKFCQSFLGLIESGVEWATIRGTRVFYFGADVAPALVGVGLIVGLPISLQIFTGGAIGWLIAIPVLFGGVEPTGSAVETAKELWSTQVRYMGVGAMVVGGIVSIWRVRSGLVAAVHEVRSQFGAGSTRAKPEAIERNLSGTTILLLACVATALITGVYYSLIGSLPITLLTTLIMIAMSFFFTAVASYIVGLVGNSNSPVSGMTITAVLGTGALIYLFNATGAIEIVGNAAIIATLGVAGVVCCVACTAGDVCNDLKTGHLVGASPRSQQLLQVAGVAVAALVMAPVMNVLHAAAKQEDGVGIGGETLPAPQAVLFAQLAKGLFGDGQLPWGVVAWGVGIGVAITVADSLLAKTDVSFRLHVMPVAVGIYLPFGISVPILLGGLLHSMSSRHTNLGEPAGNGRGVLVASGIIAGESLMGVLLGFLAYAGYTSLKLGEDMPWREALAIGALLLVSVWMYTTAIRRPAGR